MSKLDTVIVDLVEDLRYHVDKQHWPECDRLLKALELVLKGK